MKKTELWTMMREVLVRAHKDNIGISSRNIGKDSRGTVSCNNKAITADFCMGITDNPLVFNEWLNAVKVLYTVVCDYSFAKHNYSASRLSDEQIQIKRNAIFPEYKVCLRFGSGNEWSDKLHVDEFDVDSLVGYVEEFSQSVNGTYQSVRGMNEFRRNLEALIGCKIAKNSVMTLEDKTLLKSYYGYMSTISTSNSRIAELTTQISEAEKKEVEMIALYKKLGIDDEQMKVVITPFSNKVSELKKSKKETEEAKQKAENSASDIEKKVALIEAKIAKIK